MIKKLIPFLFIVCLFGCRQYQGLEVKPTPPEPVYQLCSGPLVENILPGKPWDLHLPLPVPSASNPISVQHVVLTPVQFNKIKEPTSIDGDITNTSIKPSQFYGAFLPTWADDVAKRAMKLSLESLVNLNIPNTVVFYSVYDSGNISYCVIYKSE